MDKRVKILAVDDNPDILDVLTITLEEEFDVATASTGKEALEGIVTEKPDIVILDYMLPDTTGIEICKEIRKNPLFIHLPILMLTGKSEVEDKIEGLESGADDYMVKPFSPEELVARVKMLIRRSTISLDANPLSRLPGNISINREIEKRLNTNQKFAVLYIDMDNFKALNDYYGFERGDEAIKNLAQVIIESVQAEGTVHDFIGHIGGDDFVVITVPEKAESIAKKIIKRFDKIVPSLYDEKDRIKGYIETKNRSGNVQKFRLLTVSIGITSNLYKEFSHIAEISSIGAELKEKAKKISGSSYVFDRRGSGEDNS